VSKRIASVIVKEAARDERTLPRDTGAFVEAQLGRPVRRWSWVASRRYICWSTAWPTIRRSRRYSAQRGRQISMDEVSGIHKGHSPVAGGRMITSF